MKKWTERFWDTLWDVWCIVSIIGIWPRYIEPRLLTVTRITLPARFFSPSIGSPPFNCSTQETPHSSLSGLKILQFSDLHWSKHFSPSFQKKLIHKINALKPDIIVFTGDFICRSKLEDPERLKETLNALHATHGCFAVLGNHDYAQFVTVADSGDYDIEECSSQSDIVKGFKRLFQPIRLSGQVSERALKVEGHHSLMALIKETPFQLLNNRTIQVDYHGAKLNICGLEEYSLGRFRPSQAFRDYDEKYPGIVRVHNPDAIYQLTRFPGMILLSGHTHGGQVNLPGFWSRFTRIEHAQFKRGLKKLEERWAYINRGISSVMPFRWFSLPELTLFTII